jgi:hypothetical protein
MVPASVLRKPDAKSSQSKHRAAKTYGHFLCGSSYGMRRAFIQTTPSSTPLLIALYLDTGILSLLFLYGHIAEPLDSRKFVNAALICLHHRNLKCLICVNDSQCPRVGGDDGKRPVTMGSSFGSAKTEKVEPEACRRTPPTTSSQQPNSRSRRYAAACVKRSSVRRA